MNTTRHLSNVSQIHKAYQCLTFAVFLFLALPGISQNNQFLIKGVVKDGVTQETLPFATVFLASTTYGTVTNDKGEFQLRVLKPGTYDLIVSFLGYTTFSRTLVLNEQQIFQFDIRLESDTRDLGKFVVTARKDAKWREDLERFKRTFLGVTVNSQFCKIENQEVLDFYYDDETMVFEAFASEPLQIKNQALGYDLKYVLEDFKIYDKEGFSTFYGYTSFEPMKTKRARKQLKWEERRKVAYFGSIQHFFSSLFYDRTELDGFEIFPAKDMEGGGRMINQDPVSLLPYITTSDDRLSKKLKFDNYLYVTYDRELEPIEFEQREVGANIRISATPIGRRGEPQMSWFSLMEDVDEVEFEGNGYLVNPLAIITQGYWAFEKVADMMPFNYEPPASDN